MSDMNKAISPGTKIRNARPDLVLRLSYEPRGDAFAVGDIKLNQKWSHDMWKAVDSEKRRDFRQVLAQINFYMEDQDCPYGIVITEKELVAVYQQSSKYIKISDPFPLITSTSSSDRFGADLALMCLALWVEADLGSGDDNDHDDPDYIDPWLPEPPEEAPDESSSQLAGNLPSSSSYQYVHILSNLNPFPTNSFNTYKSIFTRIISILCMLCMLLRVDPVDKELKLSYYYLILVAE